MAKFITTKYGTKINVEGLQPDQVSKVLATAQDKGAYGAKGASLAAALQKKGQAGGMPGVVRQPKAPTAAIGGGKVVAKDPGVIDLTGAPEVRGGSEIMGDAQKASYDYITKDYATNKAQKIEAKKQELANRGIPYNPDPNSLYGRSISEIDKEFQSMDDQAKNQSFTAGVDATSTLSGADMNASESFLKGAGLKDQSAQNLFSTNLNAILQNAQLSDAEKNRQVQKWIAQLQASTSRANANTAASSNKDDATEEQFVNALE